MLANDSGSKTLEGPIADPKTPESIPALLSMFPSLKNVEIPFWLKSLPSDTLSICIFELSNSRSNCNPAIAVSGVIKTSTVKLSPVVTI